MTTAMNKRIEVRCTTDLRDTIDKAVSLSGRRFSEFVLAAVEDAAVRTIRNYENMKLNARDSVQLATALLNPPAPNAKLRAAAKRHKTANS
ncbi:MAG: DUF1778 domain-containing protein [Woeseia sp.]